jgi:chemotaxis protein MotB
MNISRLLIIATMSLAMLSSCVSSRKYKDALSREQNLMAQIEGLNKDIANLKTQISESQNENSRLINQIDAAGKNAAELARLSKMTQEQLEEEQKRLTQMRQLMDQQRQAIENLRKKMTDALVNFKPEELSVSIKNGKVYVSLQESLLFPSGSAVVNPKGKEALGTLAEVLNLNPDINVLIEGHTDSIPIKGKYEDNWALSVGRSTAIVRILTNTYKVDPLRVAASGRSIYEPVDTNETPEGRARNRRTEIILSPKLDELMKLLEGNIENALIHYHRSNVAGAKQSDVILYQHEPNAALKNALATALGIKTVVEKKRKIYFVENVKLHFDQVAGLGSFIEVEAIDKDGLIGIDKLKEQCGFYSDFFEISPNDIVAESYSDLVLTRL